MHSNCLFEALKAKIKHPNTVQILFLKGRVFGKYSHFMWRENDEVKKDLKLGPFLFYSTSVLFVILND